MKQAAASVSIIFPFNVLVPTTAMLIYLTKSLLSPSRERESSRISWSAMMGSSYIVCASPMGKNEPYTFFTHTQTHTHTHMFLIVPVEGRCTHFASCS